MDTFDTERHVRRRDLMAGKEFAVNCKSHDLLLVLPKLDGLDWI